MSQQFEKELKNYLEQVEDDFEGVSKMEKLLIFELLQLHSQKSYILQQLDEFRGYFWEVNKVKVIFKKEIEEIEKNKNRIKVKKDINS